MIQIGGHGLWPPNESHLDCPCVTDSNSDIVVREDSSKYKEIKTTFLASTSKIPICSPKKLIRFPRRVHGLASMTNTSSLQQQDYLC
jgi:hypothetical protein